MVASITIIYSYISWVLVLSGASVLLFTMCCLIWRRFSTLEDYLPMNHKGENTTVSTINPAMEEVGREQVERMEIVEMENPTSGPMPFLQFQTAEDGAGEGQSA